MMGLTSVGVFLLLFLVSTALVAASPLVYVVQGYWQFDGIYEETNDTKLIYKRVSQLNINNSAFLNSDPDHPDSWTFLYSEPDHPDTWTFGMIPWYLDGQDFFSVRPLWRAPASAGKPASTQWKRVGPGAPELRSFVGEDIAVLNLKVVEVKNIGADELEKKLKEGYKTEE